MNNTPKENKLNMFDYFNEVIYSFFTPKDSPTEYYGEVRFHFYNAEGVLVTEFTDKNQIDEVIKFEEKRIKGFKNNKFPLVFDDIHEQRRIWDPKRHISILKGEEPVDMKFMGRRQMTGTRPTNGGSQNAPSMNSPSTTQSKGRSNSKDLISDEDHINMTFMARRRVMDDKFVESGRQLKTTVSPISQLESDEWDQIVAELTKKPDEEKVEYLKKAVESGRRLKVNRNLSGKDKCNKNTDEDKERRSTYDEIWGIENEEIDESGFDSWMKERSDSWLKEHPRLKEDLVNTILNVSIKHGFYNITNYDDLSYLGERVEALIPFIAFNKKRRGSYTSNDWENKN